jgi:hypothetical protein
MANPTTCVRSSPIVALSAGGPAGCPPLLPPDELPPDDEPPDDEPLPEDAWLDGNVLED